MYIWFLGGVSLKLSYEGIFKIFTYAPMLKRVTMIAFLAGLTNPFNWMLRDHLLFPFFIVLITVILIGITYISFFQISLMVASVLKRRTVFEPFVMLLGFLFAYPAVFWVLRYVPFGGPVPVDTLAFAFVFAYCSA